MHLLGYLSIGFLFLFRERKSYLFSYLSPISQGCFTDHLSAPGTKTPLNVAGMGLWTRHTNRDIVYFPSEWRSHCHASLCGRIDERTNIIQILRRDRTYAYSILGDTKDLDTAYLQTLGPVQILTLEEIFGY